MNARRLVRMNPRQIRAPASDTRGLVCLNPRRLVCLNPRRLVWP
jgi:hypothetical protein